MTTPYKVANGRSFISGGRSYPPGSRLTSESSKIPPERIERLVRRGILVALATAEPVMTAPVVQSEPGGPQATVTETPRPPEPGEEVEAVDLETLTVKELTAECNARKIEVGKKWKKADFITAIETHDAAQATAAPAGEAAVVKTAWTIDPETLQGQDLASLNLMIAERKGTPAFSIPEAIATLSKDYKKR